MSTNKIKINDQESIYSICSELPLNEDQVNDIVLETTNSDNSQIQINSKLNLNSTQANTSDELNTIRVEKEEIRSDHILNQEYFFDKKNQTYKKSFFMYKEISNSKPNRNKKFTKEQVR